MTLLLSIDLSNFNTQNLNEMDHMFKGCISLKYITLSNFDTSKVTNMREMFNYCHQLLQLISLISTHKMLLILITCFIIALILII